MKVTIKPMSKIGNTYYQHAEISFDNTANAEYIYDAIFDVLHELDYNIPFFYDKDKNVLYIESCHTTYPEECNSDLNRLVKDFAVKYKELADKGIPDDFLKEREYEL